MLPEMAEIDGPMVEWVYCLFSILSVIRDCVMQVFFCAVSIWSTGPNLNPGTHPGYSMIERFVYETRILVYSSKPQNLHRTTDRKHLISTML